MSKEKICSQCKYLQSFPRKKVCRLKVAEMNEAYHSSFMTDEFEKSRYKKIKTEPDNPFDPKFNVPEKCPFALEYILY